MKVEQVFNNPPEELTLGVTLFRRRPSYVALSAYVVSVCYKAVDEELWLLLVRTPNPGYTAWDVIVSTTEGYGGLTGTASVEPTENIEQALHEALYSLVMNIKAQTDKLEEELVGLRHFRHLAFDIDEFLDGGSNDSN